MQSIKNEQFNQPLAESQEEYNTMYVAIQDKDPLFPVSACFELTDAEIAEIVKTKKIYYTQCLFLEYIRDSNGDIIRFTNKYQFHPMSISVVNPYPNSNGIDK